MKNINIETIGPFEADDKGKSLRDLTKECSSVDNRIFQKNFYSRKMPEGKDVINFALVRFPDADAAEEQAHEEMTKLGCSPATVREMSIFMEDFQDEAEIRKFGIAALGEILSEGKKKLAGMYQVNYFSQGFFDLKLIEVDMCMKMGCYFLAVYRN